MANFDFHDYVERRKGARAAEIREGLAYAYAGDRRILRTLDRVRPVQTALRAAVELWRMRARAELLGPAVRVSATVQPEVHGAALECAAQLHVGMPAVFVTPAPIEEVDLCTLGSDDEAAILVHSSLPDQLSPRELVATLGRELGHMQNRHVALGTTLYLLRHAGERFGRWTVRPALAALELWERRAEITADRAALIACRDLDVASSAIGKRGASEGRRGALALFAQSRYYTGLSGEATGLSPEECDARVAELLK